MKQILAATTCVAALLSAAPALANCDDLSPGSGDTVTCTVAGGVETTGLDDNSSDVTVVVEAGAAIDTSGSGDDAIKLRDVDNKVFNFGTITGGDEAIIGGNGLRVENDGTISAEDHAIVGETRDEVVIYEGTPDEEEVRVPSANMVIINNASGLIEAGGDAVKAGDGLKITNHGTMTAGDDLVQAEEVVQDGSDWVISGADDVEVENHGTMTATDKGITVDDGERFRLTNHDGATITSLESEAVEAGDDAEVTNLGTGRILGFDDAVQVGERARIENHGLIENTQTAQDLADDPDLEAQDAIDIDSGEIFNYGTIRSTTNAAIDYDESVVAESLVYNEGTISGTIAVETDPANDKGQKVENVGLIEGTSGLALNLGGGRDILLNHTGGTILGGADFGSGDDLFTLDGTFAGIIGGAGALFDGGADVDTFSVTDFLFSDLSATRAGDIYALTFDDGTYGFSISLTNWESFVFGGTSYALSDIQAIATPVPLPAALPLLMAALGGLGLAGRRRRG